MMRKSLAIHGILALLCVAAAYTAWLRPKQSRQKDAVEILGGSAEALTEIGYADANLDIAVRRAGGNVEVHLRKALEKPRPEAAATAPAAPSDRVSAASPTVSPEPVSPPEYGPEQLFPPTAAAKELFGRFAPLLAVRKIGTVDAARVKSFGLGDSAPILRLRFGNEEHRLKIGAANYGGAGVYAQLANGEVVLLESSLFQDLKSGANTLAERSLLPISREKIERVVISAGQKQREIVQRYREDQKTAFWADPVEPDAKLPQTASFIDRLLRARMSDFTAGRPQGGAALRVEVFGDGQSLGSLSLWPTNDGAALAQASAFGERALAVPKAGAESLLNDLDSILSEAP